MDTFSQGLKAVNQARSRTVKKVGVFKVYTLIFYSRQTGLFAPFFFSKRNKKAKKVHKRRLKMQKGKILLIFIVQLSLIQMSFSQERLTLTLEKSVRIALAHNPYNPAAEERLKKMLK